MTLTSPLHDEHVALDATLVEFAGWEMPVRYSGDKAEHLAVRSAAGVFDLSHMGELIVRGADAAAALDYALVGAISRVPLARAKYTMLCTPEGGVIDDLIVYRRDHDHFLIVANAGNKDEVARVLTERFADYDVVLEDESATLALIAVQGPASPEIVARMCELGAEDIGALKYFAAANVVLEGGIHAYVARTGYTGEDGFELFVGSDEAVATWRLALATGAQNGMIPCGLSARDTLRMEAGMPLYGQELSRDGTPFDAGLGWVINFGSDETPRGDFVGRDALEAAKAAGPTKALVGLVGDGRRSPRTGYAVTDESDNQVGVVTSGAPSPTLDRPIGMAYVPPALAEPGTVVGIDVRGRREEMTVAALPLYKRGA